MKSDSESRFEIRQKEKHRLRGSRTNVKLIGMEGRNDGKKEGDNNG
jgi:hypothetical protein